MAGRLDGRIAFITGASQGLGAMKARVFSAEGAQVVIGDIQSDLGKELAASLPGPALFLKLDVTQVTDWDVVAGEVRNRFGRLDVLVNNAGIAPTGKRFDQAPLEEHHRQFDVNLHGTFYGMRSMLPLLQLSPSPSIINISSIAGLAGLGAMTSYVASKFAVTGLTKAAAIELGPLGIRVNTIHPGVIATAMLEGLSDERSARIARTVSRQPFARLGTAEEVAAVALFLASDDSSYCTGADFVVDGGQLAGPYRDPMSRAV